MCSICGLDTAFALDHPMARPVALATRAAIEAGLIPHAPADAPGALGALRARTRAIEALRAVQDRLERAVPPERLAALPDFFVLVIEVGTWGFFRATPDGFDGKARPTPPRVSGDAADRDAVVVLSETVARALAEGRLPFDRTEASGLIAVDADPERMAAIADALRAAWPAAGFGRFVCA